MESEAQRKGMREIYKVMLRSIKQDLGNRIAWVDYCSEILYNVRREIFIIPVHVAGGDQAKLLAWKTYWLSRKPLTISWRLLFINASWTE
jgi:hypothetical protein